MNQNSILAETEKKELVGGYRASYIFVYIFFAKEYFYIFNPYKNAPTI